MEYFHLSISFQKFFECRDAQTVHELVKKQIIFLSIWISELSALNYWQANSD